jgi:hypothetical protein
VEYNALGRVGSYKAESMGFFLRSLVKRWDSETTLEELEPDEFTLRRRVWHGSPSSNKVVSRD